MNYRNPATGSYTIQVPKDARTGTFRCGSVRSKNEREEPVMARMEPVEITVKVELSDRDRALLEMLVKAGQGGIVHRGTDFPDDGDKYFGIGGYGSQDR